MQNLGGKQCVLWGIRKYSLGFPSMNISLQVEARPLHCFHVFSRLMTCQRVITLFLQTLAFYYVDDVKIHTSEHLKDLGSHFLKTAFGPSVWIQIHIKR